MCVSFACGSANLWERAWESTTVAMALFTNRILHCAEWHALMTSVVALRLVDECCNSTHTHTHTVSDISLKASYEITAERMGSFVIWNSLRSLSVLHLSVSPSNLTLPRSDERRPWCLYVSALEALWRVFEVSTGKSVSLRWFLMFIFRDFVAVTKLPLLDFGGKAQIWLCCIF